MSPVGTPVGRDQTNPSNFGFGMAVTSPHGNHSQYTPGGSRRSFGHAMSMSSMSPRRSYGNIPVNTMSPRNSFGHNGQHGHNGHNVARSRSYNQLPGLSS